MDKLGPERVGVATSYNILSNDYGDGDGDGIRKATALHVHHPFLYVS